MTKEEKLAWAAALRPGHLVSCGEIQKKVVSCVPIWGLGRRGSLIFSVCMNLLGFFDSIFGTLIEPRIEVPTFGLFVRCGMKRIVDFEVMTEDGVVHSAVHELLPIL